MKNVTSSYLQKKFGDFNEKYFNRVLPPCDMRAVNDCFRLGLYLGGKKIKHPIIYIVKRPVLAKKTFWTEEDLDNIIIHEMIHLYVDKIMHRQTGLFQHGYFYRKVCKRLKKEYGLKVKLSAYRFEKTKTPSSVLEYLKAFFRNFFIGLYELIL